MKKLVLASILMLSALSAVSMALETQDQPEARFCRYENGEWLFCGRNREWWNQNHPGIWERQYEPYGVVTRWNEKESFSRLSEPEEANFEMSVYNTNR